MRSEQLRLPLGGRGLPQCTAIRGPASLISPSVVDAWFRMALGTTEGSRWEKLGGTRSVRELPKLHTSVLTGRPVIA